MLAKSNQTEHIPKTYPPMPTASPGSKDSPGSKSCSSQRTLQQAFSPISSPICEFANPMEAPVGLKNYSLRCSLNSVFRLIQSMPKLMGILEIFAEKLSNFDNLLPNEYLTIGSFLLCGRDLCQNLMQKSTASLH